MTAVERRLELLKMEGIGFNRSEIVKELSDKYNVTERTVYYDFEKRATWQPTLQGIKGKGNILMKVLNRYEQIYRQASRKFLTASNENIQIGALKVMLEANKYLREATQDEKVILEKVIGEISWYDPDYVICGGIDFGHACMLKETLKCGFDPSYPFSCLTFSFSVEILSACIKFRMVADNNQRQATTTPKINAITKISIKNSFTKVTPTRNSHRQLQLFYAYYQINI